MLGKLIKNEFRATARIILPLIAATVILSPFMGWIFNLLDLERLDGIWQILGVLLVTLFFMLLFALFVILFVLMIRRFYINLMCDEGYLTFTLPVDVSGIIFSKLIACFVWFVAVAATCFCAMQIMFAVTKNHIDLSFIKDIAAQMLEVFGAGNVFLYIIEAVLCAFFMSSAVCLQIYAAIALGHCFSNYKNFLSFCFYIMLSFVSGGVFAIGTAVINTGIFDTLVEFAKDAVRGMAEVQMYTAMGHGLLLGASSYFLIVSAIMYVPTLLTLKKHKNLL